MWPPISHLNHQNVIIIMMIMFKTDVRKPKMMMMIIIIIIIIIVAIVIVIMIMMMIRTDVRKLQDVRSHEAGVNIVLTNPDILQVHFVIIIIIVTRPRPTFGRLGLGGSPAGYTPGALNDPSAKMSLTVGPE